MTPGLRSVMTAAAQHPDGFGRWAGSVKGHERRAPLSLSTINKAIRAGLVVWSRDDGRYHLTELGAQLCARAGITVIEAEEADA